MTNSSVKAGHVKIKVLVTDDSAFMRTAVRMMLKDDDGIDVIGEARDALTAIQMVETLNPDVITMDVDMPGMDGVMATRIIMERFPRPIIMLSSLTDRGSETTIQALAAGAVDFIPKKSSFVQLDIAQISSELHKKIRFWGERHLVAAVGTGKTVPDRAVKGLQNFSNEFQPELVVIGASTGGPAILSKLLCSMGRLTCPVVIAQHMPSTFTEGFARHLSMDTGLNVVHASDGLELLPGVIAVCPGGVDTTVSESRPGRLHICLSRNSAALIHPSVNMLFASAARLSRKTAAIILTGMGSDGTLGARALAGNGCPVLVQEPGECTVDGMPSSAIEGGHVNDVLPVDGIGKQLRKWAGVGDLQYD